ncbi:Outer membrane protein OmpA [Enhydrobacter aerosaccus]|uniref:Outer membrane protein OmpA n=1 Tax=Enhydrobacter aerosaccus TaxID=225324 RepID=A0A1T4T9Y0_9HYPH|nr:OmpA family protein [Enhydrobacter aerosaccus]SKA37272.1 Outer membrane protein OmpA [Enhydrobacter aerosaccus]
MIKKVMFLGGALMALPLCAQAQTISPQQGFYLGAGGGLNWNLGATTSTGSTVSTWTGWAVGGKLGYDFVGPRAELEVGYGQIPTNVNIPGTALTNKVGQLTVMANALYDFMPASVITPYIGAGLGIAFVDSNSALGSTQFAYQGMVGLAYNIDSQWRLSLEGRYVGTTNPSVNINGFSVSYPNNNLLALAGVVYKFGAPEQAPPPAPPPVQAPSYMVFFDWDRANLSPQALNTIKQAADAYKTKGNARITATGHTDRSGPESYNMALSLRRANAVKDALVRDGVPATAISVIGKGEADPLVPTADGVREPQNRRVVIVLQ